jgi:hypothetical protein
MLLALRELFSSLLTDVAFDKHAGFKGVVQFAY